MVKLSILISIFQIFIDIEPILNKRNKLTGSPQLNQKRLIQRMGTSDRLLPLNALATKTESFDTDGGKDTPSKKMTEDVSFWWNFILKCIENVKEI